MVCAPPGRASPIPGLRPAKVHQDPAEVRGVLFDAVVQRLDLFLVEKAQHVFLVRAGAFSRNDPDERCFLGECLVDDRPQCVVDIAAPVIDVVQIQLSFIPALVSSAFPGTGHEVGFWCGAGHPGEHYSATRGIGPTAHPAVMLRSPKPES